MSANDYVPELGQAVFGNWWQSVNARWATEGLYKLSKKLAKRNPDKQHRGLLGGEYGCGQEFENEVFEMFPYYWGECDCGGQTPRHKKDCDVIRLGREWISDPECTCGAEKGWEPHPCTKECSTRRPNFRHKKSGLEISWYKYIGRGMSANKPCPDFGKVIEECISSLKK